MNNWKDSGKPQSKRLSIAFFDYPDVFEDFYPHYGVDQKTFATNWHNTANHGWIKIIQETIGDITWYVLSLKPELKEFRHQKVGCKIKFIASSWIHRKLWSLFYLPRSAWRLKRFYRFYATIASYAAILSCPLIKALKRDKPDVIFVQDYASGKYDMLVIFAKLQNIPLITFHSGSTPEKYLGKFLRRFTISKADWIFPSGQKELKMLEKKFNVSPEWMNIIRPPINVDVFKPIEREKACEITKLGFEKRYWIFVGRLDVVKRISSIIEAFSIIAKDFSNIELLIVGVGSEEKKLKQQVHETIPNRVHFLGWISNDEEKALLYNASECLILASWREASPAVIGEAFACGIPVASSDVGTISDLVKPQFSGWLFPAGDDQAMLQCFLDIAAHPEKVRSMKSVVRKLAEDNVSIEKVTEALEVGFRSLKPIEK